MIYVSLSLWKYQCLCFHYWDCLTIFWQNNWQSICTWRSRKTRLLLLFIIFSAGNLCQVAGWGHLSSNDLRNPNKLQEVEVPVMDLETCARNFLKDGSMAKVTRNTICAGRQGKDSCFVGFLWILFIISFSIISLYIL